MESALNPQCEDLGSFSEIIMAKTRFKVAFRPSFGKILWTENGKCEIWMGEK